MDFRDLLLGLVVICTPIFGVYSCVNSESYKAEQRREAEQEAKDQQPRVIREVDGCKVYAFKSGNHWHYFTRCPASSTTTDTARTECRSSGKTRTCETKFSTITTEEKP